MQIYCMLYTHIKILQSIAQRAVSQYVQSSESQSVLPEVGHLESEPVVQLVLAFDVPARLEHGWISKIPISVSIRLSEYHMRANSV